MADKKKPTAKERAKRPFMTRGDRAAVDARLKEIMASMPTPDRRK